MLHSVVCHTFCDVGKFYFFWFFTSSIANLIYLGYFMLHSTVPTLYVKWVCAFLVAFFLAT